MMEVTRVEKVDRFVTVHVKHALSDSIDDVRHVALNAVLDAGYRVRLASERSLCRHTTTAISWAEALDNPAQRE